MSAIHFVRWETGDHFGVVELDDAFERLKGEHVLDMERDSFDAMCESIAEELLLPEPYAEFKTQLPHPDQQSDVETWTLIGLRALWDAALSVWMSQEHVKGRASVYDTDYAPQPYIFFYVTENFGEYVNIGTVLV